MHICILPMFYTIFYHNIHILLFSCTARDYEGWPEKKDEFPISHMTEEHRRLIAEKCSAQDNPAMPNLPMSLMVTAGGDGKNISSAITPPPAHNRAVVENQSNVVVGMAGGGGGSKGGGKKKKNKGGVTPSPMPPKAVGSLIESKEKSEDQWSDKKDQCMQVTVKDVSGKVLNINTAPSDTIDFIKERIHNEWCIHPAHQRLFFNTGWLEDGKKLSHYNIKAGDVIKLPRNMERIQITVKDSTNRTGSFYFDRHDSIHSVKAKIRDEWQIPPTQQRLLFGYKPDLKDDCTLYDYNIQDKDRLHLVLRMHPKTRTRIQITVKDSQLTVDHTFHVDSSDTIYSVKKKIEDKYGVPPSIQRLVFCGAWQEDEHILSDCNIKDGDTLRMTLGLLFKDEDDGEDYVEVELSDSIDKVIRTYCKVKKISPDHHQFSCQDQDIPHDCTDTVQFMGQTHHLDMITVKKVVVNVYVKDEDGMITKFCVRLQIQIHKIISTYSKRRETSAEQLLFTNNGAEISPNCKDTIESLAIEENDTIYVAKKTFGENLTERSIEIMYGMKGSGDNPSFRPHLQIIDMVEAKHRNHWKVSISKNPYYT